jgi:hypothetical protein
MYQQTKLMHHKLDHVAGNTEWVASSSDISRPDVMLYMILVQVG